MSSVDAAVTALVAVFTTAAPPPATLVVDGPPEAASLTGQQVVAVGAEITGTSEFDSMAPVATTEDYIVPVTVSVSLPGNSMSVARNAAIALYETLKAAVIANPTLGLASDGSFYAVPTGTWSLPQQADENGRHAAFRWGVHVIATNT